MFTRRIILFVAVQLSEVTVSLRGATATKQSLKIASLPSVARNDTRRWLPRAELLLLFCAVFLGLAFSLYAGETQIKLKPGVNYISIPNGTKRFVEEVLSALPQSSRKSAYYDTSQKKYFYFVPDTDYREFSEFEFLRGYWVKNDTAGEVTLTLSGTPTTYSIILKTGWNAIGCPGDKEISVEQALSPLKLGEDYSSVWRYVSQDAPWYQECSKDKFIPGEGYWIKMLKDKTWNFAVDTTPPQAGSISPASGTSVSGQKVSFVTTYTDADGWENIQSALFLVNDGIRGENCFYGYYNQNTNLLYLRNNANSDWLGGFAPGSGNVIENSYVKLDCSKTSASGSGNTLTVKWNVIFKPGFSGSKKTYLYCRDDYELECPWQEKGSWNINNILSISLDNKLWDIGTVTAGKTVSMNKGNRIIITNDGTAHEALELKLSDPSGWSAATSAGQEKYVLSGIFCGKDDTPVDSSFNQDGFEDVISTLPKKSSASVFAYSQGAANGAQVASGEKRALFLQFKLPTITQQREEQTIQVTVTAQLP